MLNKQVMINVFSNLLNQSKKSYDEFNAADGKIGDGDLGITILNGLEEINNNIEKFTDDLSTNFMLCSQAFVKKSGSSFGTLIAFSFMNISRNLKGKNTCDHEDIVNMIDTAMSTIQERGKTKVGDKTILDTLDFISRNLKATKDDINYPELFKSSANEALNAFKGKKILIGRARMFEDKTKDLDDPGMLALHKLSEAF
ncbi:dihydroxyacetone kinase subunit L [Candidatus Pelagibacter bacterium]|nr:dihydroxyacetone kinase subunit L [Candidatus Pelagibacter bacterium]